MKARKILVATLMLLCCISSAIAEGGITPMYVNIRTTQATLSISGDTATCVGGVWAFSSTGACSITVKLQKQDGGSWTTLKSWTDTGSGSASASGTYAVSAGTYRVSASGNVDGESFSVNSATKTKN